MKRRWIGRAALALLCVSTLICAPGSHAQTPPVKTPEITGIAHVAFRVSDLDRELAFLGKLGFEESFTNVEAGRIGQVFVKINDLQFIEVFPQTDPSQRLGMLHACFESDALKGLNKLYLQQGLKPTPVQTAAAGNLLFSLNGPDGETIEFTQYMPDSRQMQDRGNHLGDQRVSDELLGYELPVRDLATAGKFYSTLGFEEVPESGNLRLSIAANADLRIELDRARVGAAPQFLFPIADARKAAEELRAAKLKVDRQGKLVFARDPDGNSFVFLETSTSRGIKSFIPWRHR